MWGDLEEPGSGSAHRAAMSGRICTAVPWTGPHPTHTYSPVAAKESRSGSQAGFSVGILHTEEPQPGGVELAPGASPAAGWGEALGRRDGQSRLYVRPQGQELVQHPSVKTTFSPAGLGAEVLLFPTGLHNLMESV